MLRVVHVARAGIHPAQTHQVGGRVVGDLVEQFLPDLPVDHFAHVRGVAEQEWQIQHVQVVDHLSQRTDADPGQGDHRRDRKSTVSPVP